MIKIRPLVVHFLFFFGVFCINFAIFAQSSGYDYDEEFLDSLPDEIRSEIESDDEDDLDPLFRANTSVEANKAILEKIRDQLEELDKRINSEPRSASTSLKRFGEDFFSSLQSTFSPINIPIVTSDYRIGYGDTLTINLYGQNSDTFDLVVNRDGTITIPEFGKVFVFNNTPDQAIQSINSLVSKSAIGVTATIDVKEMKEIQVAVLGGAKYPGVYTVNPNSTILTLIDIAGGISKNGSFRNISLLRNAERIQSFDLYEMLIFGKISLNNRLHSGDVIMINPTRTLVPISGGIMNPAIYELLPGENLRDLLSFSGGLSSNFYGYDYLTVKRFDQIGAQEIDVAIENLEDFLVRPRDSVLVPSFESSTLKQAFVKIEGRVERPGIYTISDGDKLSDIIEIAGGYESNAYEYGAALFRDSVSNFENEYSNIDYANTISYLVSNMATPSVLIPTSALDFVKEELKSKSFKGRVITEFNLNKLKSDPSLDIELRDGDKIIIPPLEKIVYIVGEFNTPSNQFYSPTKTIAEYIYDAGGLKDSSLGEIIIIDPDGKSWVYKESIFFSKKIALYPGSIVYAPRNISNLSGINYASAVAPIISSLALSLASLSTITD